VELTSPKSAEQTSLDVARRAVPAETATKESFKVVYEAPQYGRSRVAEGEEADPR